MALVSLLNKSYAVILCILLVASSCYLCIVAHLECHWSVTTFITAYRYEPIPTNQSDVLSSDDIKRKDYSVCDIRRIVFAAHHKSGTNLFKEIKDVLNGYCYHNCNTSVYVCCRGHLPETIQSVNSHLKPESNEIGILLHINRHPVNMILSGYNYHKYQTNELWTNIMTIDGLRRYIRKHYTANENFHECYSKLFYQNDQNNIIYDKYIAHDTKHAMENMYNHSIRYVLNNTINMTHGIIWEYERWRCLEGPEMLDSFLYVQQLQRNKSSNIFAENFYMEQFTEDYNGTCYQLLDILGIFHQNDRAKFMNELIRYISSGNNKLVTGHDTGSLYDKDFEVDILLKDSQRCFHLKNFTKVLQMNWGFNRYC